MAFRHVWVALALAVAIPACGATGTNQGDFTACTEATQEACTCFSGYQSTRTCTNGVFGECDCRPKDAVCGNKQCEQGETCDSCTEDCGKCPLCNEAPACSKAMVPGKMTELPALDVKLEALPPEQVRERLAKMVDEAGPEMRVIAAALDETPRAGESAYVKELRRVFRSDGKIAGSMRRNLKTAGISSFAAYRVKFPELAPPLHTMGGELTTACGEAMLRVRIAKVTVNDRSDLATKDEIYCAVSAEAQTGGELRLMKKTRELSDGESQELPLAEGVVWGQEKPRPASGNLLITYDCFDVDDNAAYEKFMKAVGDASTQAGGTIGGPYGWVFGVVGVVGNVIGSAIALDKNDHLFNASQIIEDKKQLEMTNGVSWKVSRSGKVGLDWFDWTLHMEAWGCAKYGALNP